MLRRNLKFFTAGRARDMVIKTHQGVTECVEILAIIPACSGWEVGFLGMEHPLNVVATCPVALGALILPRASLWFFVEKSLFVKRHVLLMVTKQNRWFQKWSIL